MNEPIAETFQQSLGRCLQNGDFLEAFYEKFLASSDEVRERFAGTDLKRQKAVLRSSLYLIARAALGFEDGRRHLEQVAQAHGRAALDIAPHLYDLWLESLLSTASQYDPEFGPAVERAWRLLLSESIAHMVRVYRESATKPPPARPLGR